MTTAKCNKTEENSEGELVEKANEKNQKIQFLFVCFLFKSIFCKFVISGQLWYRGRGRSVSSCLPYQSIKVSLGTELPGGGGKHGEGGNCLTRKSPLDFWVNIGVIIDKHKQNLKVFDPFICYSYLHPFKVFHPPS